MKGGRVRREIGRRRELERGGTEKEEVSRRRKKNRKKREGQRGS